MKYLISNEILNAVLNEACNVKDHINFITAYCKVSTLKKIDECINEKVTKRILIRFLPSDISSGATDKELFEYCKNNNWKMYYDFSIHAKIFIFDKIKAIWGSANITNNGMGLSINPNKELSSYGEIDDEAYNKIITLYKDSNILDQETFDYITSNMDDSKVISYNIHKLKNQKIECLFPEDFPDSHTDILELYSLRSYKWLIEYLFTKENKLAYFGELSSAIHNVFSSDPKPFRKEIKNYLSDLLGCITRLKVRGLTITRPNYSECVFLDEDIYNNFN